MAGCEKTKWPSCVSSHIVFASNRENKINLYSCTATTNLEITILLDVLVVVVVVVVVTPVGRILWYRLVF